MGDNMIADQAKVVRGARGMLEFVFHPERGEEYNYTVAHWAITEGRFGKHVKSITEDEAKSLRLFDDNPPLTPPRRGTVHPCPSV